MDELKTIYSEAVGRNIKKYRLMSEMNQKELAEKLKITQGNISLYENGEREMSYELICRTCSILEIEPNELFSLI